MSGTIASGSTVTFILWMKKTANFGTMLPRAKLYLNSAPGTSLCTATGASALGNGSVTSQSLSCTTESAITVNSSDRFYVQTS